MQHPITAQIQRDDARAVLTALRSYVNSAVSDPDLAADERAERIHAVAPLAESVAVALFDQHSRDLMRHALSIAGDAAGVSA